MMREAAKFILFDSVDEFFEWLKAQPVTRIINLIQNHHTWLPDYRTFNGKNHFALLTNMENAHLERGFSEIAQTLTTFPDGSVAVCRNFDKIPAGIKGANTNGICIEHVANFDSGHDVMTQVHSNAIIDLNAYLCAKFSLTPSARTLVYHSWYNLTTGRRDNDDGRLSQDGNHKSCPGTGFYGGNTLEAAAKNFIPLVAAKKAGYL